MKTIFVMVKCELGQAYRVADEAVENIEQVSEIHSTSGQYDLLNHVLSAGIDRHWRRRAIRSLDLGGTERVLDLCTGTGDLAIQRQCGAFACSTTYSGCVFQP